MTLSLYNEDDWVGLLASISGWHDVVEAVTKDHSSLKTFVDKGYTEDPVRLHADIGAFLKSRPALRADVRSTLTNLRRLLKRTHLIAIVSDSLLDTGTTHKKKKGSRRPMRSRSSA